MNKKQLNTQNKQLEATTSFGVRNINKKRDERTVYLSSSLILPAHVD